MIDKTTKLGKRIANGEIAKGIEHFAGNRAMVEVAAEVGFDFNMIDTQLSAFDLETVEMMVATSKYAGITTLVRVPELQSSYITRILNMGVNGIIVPDVDSGAMAQEVVNAVKFQPAGKRMACPMIRAAKYGLTPWKDYVDQASKEIMSCVIVESEKGVNNLAEIAATPGLDILWLGAWDLSLSLGIQGANYTHPVMRGWLEKAGEECRKNNVLLYTTTAVNTDPEYFKIVTSQANMVCMFSDIGIFAKGCKRVLDGSGL